MSLLRNLGNEFSQIRSRIDPYYQRVAQFFRRFAPTRRARRGAVLGGLVAVVLYMGVLGAYLLRSRYGLVVDFLSGAVIGAVLYAVGGLLLMLAIQLIAQLQRFLFGFLLAGFIVLLVFMVGNPEIGWLLVLPFILAPAILGGVIAEFTGSEFRHASDIKRVGATALGLGAIIGMVYYFMWIGNPGNTEHLLDLDPGIYANQSELNMPDPSEPGRMGVRSLTYGSGEDRREEFGEGADLITKTVDGAPFLNEPTGWRAKLRNNFWGFDRRELPLNGRVWHPAGDGPYPLVLMVHGNHLMREYSDPGYAYLGELLASKGYIFVSIDENFLNSDWSADYDTENDARAWMLLEHLRQWRRWNGKPDHPFYGKVDMKNIALIGHSRGGEAVCVAAAFNELDHYPDDARVKFDYGFDIQSIVSVAQVDGQYRPSDQPTPLRDVNFLLLHGSHDADVAGLSGARQYKRIQFSDEKADYFKSILYAHRANHGQFNTVWGNRDSGFPRGYLLNTKPLLEGEAQRQIAKVYIGAFLDATLKRKKGYRPMFQDYRRALHWLPATLYVNRYADANTHFIADFDEDIDVTTTTKEGGQLSGANLDTWREKDIGFRRGGGRRMNQVVYLGWDYERLIEKGLASEELEEASRKVRNYALVDSLLVDESQIAEYRITLPFDSLLPYDLTSDPRLAFSMAEVDENPADPLEDSGEEENKEDSTTEANAGAGEETAEDADAQEKEKDQPLDATLILQDHGGQEVRFRLSTIHQLAPPLKARYTRYDKLEKRYGDSSEPVLQTIYIPFEALRRMNPAFRPQRMQSIRFRFDGARKGVIVLDEVGFQL